MTQLTRHNPDKLPVVWEARISTIPESADRDKRINPWAAVATKAWKPRHSGPAGPITIVRLRLRLPFTSLRFALRYSVELIAPRADSPYDSSPRDPQSLSLAVVTTDQQRSFSFLRKYMRWHSPFNNPDGDSTHVPNAGGGTSPTPFPFFAFIFGSLALLWVWAILQDEAMIPRLRLRLRLRLRSGILDETATGREKSGCRCRVCTLRMQDFGQPLHDVKDNMT